MSLRSLKTRGLRYFYKVAYLSSRFYESLLNSGYIWNKTETKQFHNIVLR